MAGGRTANEVGAREATRSSSVPSAVLHTILQAISQVTDVAAFLNALPVSTLPVELIALRDLGAAVSLADHWPGVYGTKIPVHYARLGIAALPEFSGVYIDAGFTPLDWLDVTLPPMMPVTLVVDPSVSSVPGAFAYNWGDRISHIITKNRRVDPICDLLGRCVNVQSVSIWRHLRRRHRATFLSLLCTRVRDPTALATAIQVCSTLATLRLDCVEDIYAALASLPSTLHHITSLSLSQSSDQYDIPILGLFEKLDPTKLLSLSIRNNYYQALRLRDVVCILGVCPSLESVCLENWTLPAASTAGACPRLGSATLCYLPLDAVRDVTTIMEWLSTSHRLRTVVLTGTVLGHNGVAARALPAWMARGLETLGLDETELGDDDASVLATALASGKNRRSLTIDVSSNLLTMASAAVLLTALGACCDVALRLSNPFLMLHYLPAQGRHVDEGKNTKKALVVEKPKEEVS
ncbi:hypothetical protein SPRG_14663 [Saprolegnia parasitica CBS 223.65]|uniref:F-box domain-containing protein n=1 Tax=Saprolegnia parasitica (strain CBS 223.65) TaxID=695850 RepID=A0A067BRQ3_SAPPC|nr:hypothetical protein SPRG_14663 [Saprolegnia parasitica CBS 223.65]KDO19480.1 hypothetical protein SPRG_14663 [Saprolegnia parasitica CBS 223.65]|eukprot:XP_012209823.1 hypothetical protein SPRG_14663 [Saprolegnia parasitica CBS 223.65]